jgi:hypothetical protein
MDRDVESMLREVRAEPRSDFVESLEERLVRASATARHPVSAARAAVALTAGLAVTLVFLGLSGLLPLDLGAADRGDARQTCETVFVQRPERRSILVVGKSGNLRLRQQVTLVRRPVRRCHPAGS